MQVPPGPEDGAEYVTGPGGAADADLPTGELDAFGAAPGRGAGQASPPTDAWGWTTDPKGNPVPPDQAADRPGAGVPAAGRSGRSRRHARSDSKWGPRRVATMGAAVLVLLGGAGAGAYLASGPAAAKGRASGATLPRPSTTVHRVAPASAHQTGETGGPTCPLTGLPAPGGKVPQRPVLAVKVGNNPSARPQSGLEDADIVFDTLAEGGITRYIAVYQCGNSPAIGPVRSVRWDDWHILQMFGRADLAFVHGITPDTDTVQSLPWVCDLDDFAHPDLYQQDPNRVPPDATYTSTAALWGACPPGPAPPAIFHFGKPNLASPVASVEIPYSYAADVVWQWSAAEHAFLHYYREGGLVADLDEHGNQLRATNVVVEVVTLQYGAYAETPGGTGDVESQTEGSGPAYVLRNGVLEKGTWNRPSWSDITTLTGADGRPMTLQPGNTWVEIVPTSDALTFTP
jgi:hypothetical protein